MTTVADVEAKKTELESAMGIAVEALKILIPGTVEYDEVVTRYLGDKAALLKIPDERVAAKVAENHDRIVTAKATLTEAITRAIGTLGLEELIGGPVKTLTYYNVPSKDAQGVATLSSGIVLNPLSEEARRKIRARMKAKKDSDEAEVKSKRAKIVRPDGTSTSPTQFVKDTLGPEGVAAEAQKATDAGNANWYPHTFIDSQAKFEEFCEKYSLVGYTRET